MEITISDWEKLTPYQFEELCTNLLELLGYENVRRLGASGDKGRDIICDKTIYLGKGIITETFSYIVQCKHYPGGLKKSHLDNDLAAAKEHKFDIWLLMTTAKLSPDLVDWLEVLSKSGNYPFKINYMDREKLKDLLFQFIQLLARYFPEKTDAADLAQAEAMELMGKGQYQEACRILKEKDDGINPRFPYLLACCFSMIASQSMMNQEKISSEAFEYLLGASERDYISHIRKKFGWPESKCRFEIHRDPELQFIKQLDAKRFDRIFSEPEEFDRIFSEPKEFDRIFSESEKKHLGGGGCFPSHTLVKLSVDKVIPIAQVRTGEELLSFLSKSNMLYSRVEKVYKTIVHNTIVINSDIITTLDQPFHTFSGWRRAGDLGVGDMLIAEEGPKLVSSIEYKEGATEVYDLSLRGIHYYYANGYLVHNKME